MIVFISPVFYDNIVLFVMIIIIIIVVVVIITIIIINCQVAFKLDHQVL